MSSLEIVETDGCSRFHVKVQPRARKSAVSGIVAGELVVHIQAPPVEGQANAALIQFLADVLGVRRSAVQLVGGDKHRRKLIAVALPAAEVRLRLNPPKR